MTEHIFRNGVEEGKRISLLYQVSLHLGDLHCRCCFILLHMHALEKWAFDRFHHQDVLAVRRWVAAGSVFSATRKAARIFFFFFFFFFFFLLLLLSNPHSHVFLPVKHLWFLQMSLTPFCLCFHHFEMHHIPLEKNKKMWLNWKKKTKKRKKYSNPEY